MASFLPPRLSDRAWVLPLLAEEGLPLCAYSFPVIFCWQESYRYRIARAEDRLLLRLSSTLGHAYLWPVGRGDPAPALEALRADADSLGEPLRLVALTRYHCNWLADRYGDAFTFAPFRDAYDYLYQVDRLADLPGRKLHAKRNHIRRLDDARPGWTWSPMTAEDVPACREMDRRWHRQAMERESDRDLTTLEEDHRAMALALDHFEALELDGVVLRWEGEVFAFSLGAPLTETVYDVHFERAHGEIQGAYAAVNRAMAQYVREKYPAVRYLNREDDMGSPGLRKAKLSYHPDHLEEVSCALAAPDGLCF